MRGGGGDALTLRVRMPDGAVKRVQALPGDTMVALMKKLGLECGGSTTGLSSQSTGETTEPTTSVADLGLKNGDFLYVKVRPHRVYLMSYFTMLKPMISGLESTCGVHRWNLVYAHKNT